MGKLSIDSATLTGIADAIREKAKTTDLIATNKMRESILAIKGGLALDVVTAASLPSTVVDGQIVVITDVAAGTVYIDTDEPGSPAAGDVWVKLEGGNDVVLALSEESPVLRGGLASATQWDGSVWFPREGRLGIDGVWQLFSTALPAIGTALNDMSWEQISAIAKNGLAPTYFATGDAKEITINGKVGNTTFTNLKAWAFILGFNHNSNIEGDNTIQFQIGKTAQTGGKNICLVDSLYGSSNTAAGYFHMDDSWSTSGGWEACEMRKNILGNDGTPDAPVANSFIAALGTDIRAVMKPVTKHTDNKGSGNTAANVTATVDYVWLPSEFEVIGKRTNANSAEQNYQKQYDYYAAGNSKVFYKHSAQTAAAIWWMRSPSTSSGSYCLMQASGGESTYSAPQGYGITPCFCV